MAKQVFTAPWYPWYVKDVLTSERVDLLSLAEEGAYRRALDKAWMIGSIPADAKDLASVIGSGCSVKIAERVLLMFDPMPKRPDRMINKKLEKVRKEQQLKYKKNSETGKKNIAKRWNKSGEENEEHSQLKNADSQLKIGLNSAKKIKTPVNIEKQTASGDSIAIATVYQPNSIQNQIQNKKEEKNKTVCDPPLREIFIGTVEAAIAKRMEVSTLSSRLAWQKAAEWAFVNGFTADHFLECYDLLKLQHWRDGPVKPNIVTDNLSNMAKLRAEIEKQNGKRGDIKAGIERTSEQSLADIGSNATFI